MYDSSLISQTLLVAFLALTSRKSVPQAHRQVVSTQPAAVAQVWDETLHLLESALNGQLPPQRREEPFYLAHSAPRSTFLILNAPSIASFILVQGWNGDESLNTLKMAVETVLRDNPVLTGKAVTPTPNWWAQPEIRIVPGAFMPDTNENKGHSFVQTIDKRKSLPLLKGIESHPSNLLDYIDSHVSPLVRGRMGTTLQQIHNESPLFEIQVILLPDGYACLYIQMSHCIGDFVTYYTLLNQIADVEREPLRSLDGDNDTAGQSKHRNRHWIQWDNPLRPTHELYPPGFTRRDVQRMYGLPFLLGVTSHVPSMPFRQTHRLLLDRNKVKAMAAELAHQEELKGSSVFTSNEVITAALCDANRSTDIFSMARSTRGLSHGGSVGFGLHDGGNLHIEIPIHRCAGRNPVAIRDMIQKGRYFEPDEVPLFPSVTGRVGRITNCVAPIRRGGLTLGGCLAVCYSPSKAFLEYCPLDTAMIYRVNKDLYGVMHNFKTMHESDFLEALLADKE